MRMQAYRMMLSNIPAVLDAMRAENQQQAAQMMHSNAYFQGFLGFGTHLELMSVRIHAWVELADNPGHEAWRLERLLNPSMYRVALRDSLYQP